MWVPPGVVKQLNIVVDAPAIHQGGLIVSRDHICHLDSLEGGIHLLLVELVYVAESRLATAVAKAIHRSAALQDCRAGEPVWQNIPSPSKDERHFSQHSPV